MKRSNLEILSTGELWVLHQKVAATVKAKIIAEKKALEDRLSQLNRRIRVEQPPRPPQAHSPGISPAGRVRLPRACMMPARGIPVAAGSTPRPRSASSTKRHNSSTAFSHSQGQKRRFDGPVVTSGLPRAADVGTGRWQFSKVPRGDIAGLK
jgi:hypothetical protein